MENKTYNSVGELFISDMKKLAKFIGVCLLVGAIGFVVFFIFMTNPLFLFYGFIAGVIGMLLSKSNY